MKIHYVLIRDLQYISIRQYIDTANKYHKTILYLENIDILKFSSRKVLYYCNNDLDTQIKSLSIFLCYKKQRYEKPYKYMCISAAIMAKRFLP